MLRIPCYQVDAFADRLFTGNPAAVCPLDAWLADETLQSIALENALSETAFFTPSAAGALRLRWFTPRVEVDLCGHATLASAFVVMTELEPDRRAVVFESRSGPLGVTRRGDRYVLDFPSRPAVQEPAGSPSALAEALGGTAPREVWRSGGLVIAVLDDARTVRDLEPRFGEIERLPQTRSVAVTAPGTGPDRDVDFVSRYFAPAAGVPEDPVTGSLHTTLAPFWADRLGRTRLQARQVSARSGELECEVRGERVDIAGRAVLVKTGTFLLPTD